MELICLSNALKSISPNTIKNSGTSTTPAASQIPTRLTSTPDGARDAAAVVSDMSQSNFRSGSEGAEEPLNIDACGLFIKIFYSPLAKFLSDEFGVFLCDYHRSFTSIAFVNWAINEVLQIV